jgi:hypothetical protein
MQPPSVSSGPYSYVGGVAQTANHDRQTAAAAAEWRFSCPGNDATCGEGAAANDSNKRRRSLVLSYEGQHDVAVSTWYEQTE